MHVRTHKIDRYSVYRRTHENLRYANDLLWKADSFQNDVMRRERRSDGQCRYCYYLSSKIGGAAMTRGACGICGKERTFGSTCVDVLCKECADRYSLCVHCGADRELRPRRRKPELPESEPQPKSEPGIKQMFLLPLKSADLKDKPDDAPTE